MKTLLIDDEPDILSGLKGALCLKGYSSRIFTNPIKAIERFKSDNFDVVVTDLKMPKMGGIEALNAVRAQDPSINVIIITGFSEPNSIMEAANKGAYAYFNKPIDIPFFLETISWIERKLISEPDKGFDIIRLCLAYQDL